MKNLIITAGMVILFTVMNAIQIQCNMTLLKGL